jgi:uncharacterized membrane protein
MRPAEAPVDDGAAEKAQTVDTGETGDAGRPGEAEAADAGLAAAASVSEPPPRRRPASPPRRRDFEETLGSRWAVWVGGVALALGGIFLVRYSIEAGLLGPGARVIGGLLFAAALLGCGEWLRRSGMAETPAALRGAYVPGVLTAAGIVTAFATVYAAYVLHGFLGDTAAFLALGLIAVGSLALALVHGPALAGLGLAAAYATPVLVSTDQPAYGALSLYLLFVTAATLGLARLRAWLWLAITAAVGTVGWSMLMTVLSGYSVLDGPIIAAYTAAAYALVHIAFVASIHRADPGLAVFRHDRVAIVLMSLFGLAALVHIGEFGVTGGGVALMVGFGVATMATAYVQSPMRLLVLSGIAVVLLGYAAFDVPFASIVDPATGEIGAGLAGLLQTPAAARLIGAGLAIGLLFAGLGLFGVLGSASRVLQAVAGSLIPTGLLVLAYLKIADFEISVGFGFAALALAGFLAVVTEALTRRLPPGEYGVDGAIAAYAVMTVATLAAGLGMMFERGVLTIALALVVPALAFVEVSRPVKALRPIALIVALLVCARVAYDPAIVGRDLGTTPVFNWLLYGYGVPALAFAAAAWRFGLTRQDPFVPAFEALAVAFTALTAVMLIHHGFNPNDIYARVSGLAEQSLMAMSLMAISLGMQWLAVRRPSPVFSVGTLVVGGVGLLSAAVGLLLVQNPMLSAEWITGGALDGTLFLGYVPPAVMALILAGVAARRTDRPTWLGRSDWLTWYVNGAASLAGLLAFTWVTLAVRAHWHSGNIGYNLFLPFRVEEGELYAYSAVWLACGLVLLAIGAVTGSRPVRMVAAALVVAVVVKVFLVDTAGLTGALRAASFIGLGAVLVLVGLAYQRFHGRGVKPKPGPASEALG